VSLNKVIVSGNLTRDPESRQAGDSTVAKFSIAINGRVVKKGGEPVMENGYAKREVVYMDAEAWGQQAEMIQEHFAKGDAIDIVGRLKMDEWDDKTTGQKRTKVFISVQEFEFRNGKGGKGDAEAAAPSKAAGKTGGKRRAAPPADEMPADSNDIPF
jgi:single-strand DNA-binding protein